MGTGRRPFLLLDRKRRRYEETEKYHLEERNENTTRPEDTLNDERFGYK